MNEVLKQRFENHMERHPKLSWADVENRLSPDTLKAITNMEETGGEPDVIVFPDGRIAYVDCCVETTKVRRSLCLDKEAWNKRKANKPAGNVVDTVKEMGTYLMNEEEYLYLQTFGDFDMKGQVWLACPEEFRKTGDGLFASKRHGRTFIFYNGADSYYSNRGFRTIIYLTRS